MKKRGKRHEEGKGRQRQKEGKARKMQEGEKEFVVGGKLAEGVGLGVGNKKIEMKGIVG